MTKEEAKKFGLQLLQGIMERNESYPVYANNVKQAIDALSEESGSSEIPKDLEEAAKEYAKTSFTRPYSDTPEEVVTIIEPEKCAGFIAGAKWQAEQLLKSSPLPEDTVLFNKGVEEGKRLMMEEFEGNRLAACDSQTKEEYERETDFAESIIEKERRQPTFSDAINYGMQLQKKQMENASIECLVCAGMEGDKWIMTYIGNYESMLKTCKAGDKVRVIIAKED